MQQVYLDNAATTAVDERVIDSMLPYLREVYGNASSTHAIGRKAKAGVEQARKAIAKAINAHPTEIYFTSGGTESDNCILRGLIYTHSIKHAITSPLEHHAVLHTLEELAAKGVIQLHLLTPNATGELNLQELEELLAQCPNSLVSLMHGNNEIGNLLDLKATGELCRQHNAFFHSDTVQTMGYYPIDVQDIHIHALVGSAHKFHGPKGVGFMYLKKGTKLNSFQTGGSQERGMRGGTENVAGIVGLAKALEVAYESCEASQQHILSLKKHLIEQLQAHIPGVEFNGASGDYENSVYKVLNVRMPEGWGNEMMLFNLDLKGIAASGGSACSSGANTGSHVLAALNNPSKGQSVRFSFSKFNTIEEIDYVVGVLKEMAPKETATS